MDGDKERGENGVVHVGVTVETPFEDAVAMTGLGRFHLTLLTTCGLCLIALIFESMSTAYIIPAVECDFPMTSLEKGFLSASFFIGMIVSSHLWGFVADTRGRRMVLALTLALDFVCSVLAALLPSLPVLIFFRILNGIWICCPSAVTYAYLGEFHSNKTRIQAIVYVCLFIAVALFAEPGLAWVVIPQQWDVELPWMTLRSWRVFLILSALPSAISFLMLWLLVPESPKFLLSVGKHDEALEVLRKMFTINNGLPAEKFPVVALQTDSLPSSAVGINTKSPLAIAHHMWTQTAPLFKPPYLMYTLIACLIQFGLYVSSNGFLIWLPELMNRVGQYNDAYPDNPACLCDIIAILAGGSPPPVPAEFVQANFSSIATTYTASEAVTATNWTTLDAGKNWTAAALDLIITNFISSSTDAGVIIGAANSAATAEPCVVTVNPVSFQNSLITGGGMAFAYVAIIPIIKCFSKKSILFVSLIVSGVCGVAMLWAQTDLQILMLPLTYVSLAGVVVSVVNAVVMDIVPTHLRAMAVCLSLCCGRLGTFITSLVLGALIDSNCVRSCCLLGGYVIFCGVLSLLLPSEAQLKKFHH